MVNKSNLNNFTNNQPYWNVIHKNGSHHNIFYSENIINKKKIGVILTCKKVIFYSQQDEAIFFEWIAKIKCIHNLSAASNELYIHIKTKHISDDNVRDIIALFYRYNIDMKQLQIFLNETNKHWFYDGKYKGFWHKRVFGK